MIDRTKSRPIMADESDRLSEGWSMLGDEYEDHGGVFEDLDVWFPWSSRGSNNEE